MEFVTILPLDVVKVWALGFGMVLVSWFAGFVVSAVRSIFSQSL